MWVGLYGVDFVVSVVLFGVWCIERTATAGYEVPAVKQSQQSTL